MLPTTHRDHRRLPLCTHKPPSLLLVGRHEAVSRPCLVRSLQGQIPHSPQGRVSTTADRKLKGDSPNEKRLKQQRRCRCDQVRQKDLQQSPIFNRWHTRQDEIFKSSRRPYVSVKAPPPSASGYSTSKRRACAVVRTVIASDTKRRKTQPMSPKGTSVRRISSDF